MAALVLSSTFLALAALAFRLYYSGSQAYGFLVKDLFLAWVPLWLALAVVRAAGDVWRPKADGARAPNPKAAVALLLGLTAVWVLFLPNSAYLLTEFVHLSPRHAVNAAARSGRPCCRSRVGCTPCRCRCGLTCC